jgi:hypothetical protein
MNEDMATDCWRFSHRDINTCDLDTTGVCIQTYMMDVDVGVVKLKHYTASHAVEAIDWRCLKFL